MMRCMTLTAYIPKHSTTVVSYQANWQSNDADELHKLIVTRCHGFQRKQTIATHKSSVRAIIMLASSARNYKKFLYSLSLYLEAALVAAFGERLINSLHATRVCFCFRIEWAEQWGISEQYSAFYSIC